MSEWPDVNCDAAPGTWWLNGPCPMRITSHQGVVFEAGDYGLYGIDKRGRTQVINLGPQPQLAGEPKKEAPPFAQEMEAKAGL